MIRCAIWYYLCNLKNVKSARGRVLLLVKFTFYLLKITLLHGCFSRFLKLQMVPHRAKKHHVCRRSFQPLIIRYFFTRLNFQFALGSVNERQNNKFAMNDIFAFVANLMLRQIYNSLALKSCKILPVTSDLEFNCKKIRNNILKYVRCVEKEVACILKRRLTRGNRAYL